MHTFFINTSRKNLHSYEILFDIHFENKALVSMDCPLSDWHDKDKGYCACVKQMSDMIDGYAELNNAYNLIVYIDLTENKAYSSIQRDAMHDREREACCRAMHILYTHVISKTVVADLENAGRTPQNVLIMFGEEKKFTNFRAAQSEADQTAIRDKLFAYIGFPDMTVVEGIAKSVDRSDAADKVDSFKRSLLDVCVPEILTGIRDSYQPEIQLWYDEVVNDADIPKANAALFDRISKLNRMETVRIGIETVSCPCDSYACRVNKSVLSLSQLNIALYLLKCVEANSIYENDPEQDKKKLIEFRAYTVEEIAPLLMAKERAYDKKVSEIESMEKSYPELKLAPELRGFNHTMFGLDRYGHKDTDLVVRDVTPEEQDSPKEDDDQQKTDTVLIKGNSKKVEVVEKSGRALLPRDEYQPFDYTYDHANDELRQKNATPEQYIAQAKRVRKHHMDYLKKLKDHFSKLLSRYAGKSKENKSALLRVGGSRYDNGSKENEALESVEAVSCKAYETMVHQYMEFCAARSVAITDIEEQCDWLVSRIHQISESLNRIKLVGLGLLGAMVVLYLPFVIIQFEAIVKNIFTFSVAVGSIGVPMSFLGLVFGAMALAQRKKYRRAWEDFKEKSDQALEANTMAARKYEQLLSTVIPAMRWVYEYKLDVEHCVACCEVADAKIEHHRRKLRDRVSAIRNILADLEYKTPYGDAYGRAASNAVNEIDYNAVFCTGKTNRTFYCVIDSRDLGLTNE